MHEARLVRNLVSEIDRVATAEHAAHVEKVTLEIGALSHVTPDSLECQFELLAHGTAAQNARLDISRSTDRSTDFVHDVKLVSITVGDG